MAVYELTGVVKDASHPAGTIAQREPSRQDIGWPRGEDGTIRVSVLRQNASPANLTGGALVLGVRRHASDLAPVISRAGTITDAAGGVVEFAIAGGTLGDTYPLVDKVEYHYDVEYVDGSGKRWQVVPGSSFRIEPVYAQPGDTQTIPTPVTPLGMGPSWETGPLGFTGQIASDGTTTELWAAEASINFDDMTGSLANVFARIAGLAWVSGGSGTLRLRYGGTSEAADGTLLLASDAITGTSPAVATWTATVAKPTGTQIVKLTIQNDTAGQVTRLRSGRFALRGAS